MYSSAQFSVVSYPDVISVDKVTERDVLCRTRCTSSGGCRMTQRSPQSRVGFSQHFLAEMEEV